MERAFSRLRKDNPEGNFDDTILCPNCWSVRKASSQSSLDDWVVSQELRNAMLTGRVDSRVRDQIIGVRKQMQSFDVFFGIQLELLVLRDKGN